MAVKNDFVGWKILAHNPHKYPEVAGKGFSINAGTEAFISLSAQVCNNKQQVLDYCDLDYRDPRNTDIFFHGHYSAKVTSITVILGDKI